MNAHAHDRDELEALKAWWQENRWFIIGGLVVSFGAVFGWRSWEAHQLKQAEAASNIYDEVLASATAKDVAHVEELTRQLQNEYSGTPYAALASMRLAAMDAESADLASAEASLRWVMDNTDDREMQLLARMRLARIMLAGGRNDDAIRTLSGVNAGKFEALYDELRGDALLAKGDREAAGNAYRKALENLPSGLGDRQLLEMKIENLELPLEVLAVTGDAVPAAAEDGQKEGGE